LNKKIYILVCATILLFLQCKRKDEVFSTNPSDRLSFSQDTISYDTLYADLHYPTQWLKVYNPNGGALSLTEVSLAGGASSPFKIIVNGQQGPVVKGLELMGGDSLFVIVDLFFDSTATTLPYLIEDSIHFVFNGQEQTVILKAVGKDAKLIAAGSLSCGTVWNNSKPIVLLGQTVVPAGCTLTIQKGTQVLASGGASLDIKGTLVVTGEKDQTVLLSGISSGKNPGQWLGLRFYEGSTGNKLSWFNIQNAATGLTFASTTAPATMVDITIDHGIFNDFSNAAIDLSYTDLTATNCLFFASAGTTTNFTKTGSARFNYCSWAGYSYDYYREGPNINLSNVSGTLSLWLQHSIVWGDRYTEITVDPAASITVDTCLVKSSSALPGTGSILNQDPLFKSPVTRNFQLQTGSPAIDKSVPSAVTDDLKGVLRDALPDLGCYEYVP
jgi:hypothetical protein